MSNSYEWRCYKCPELPFLRLDLLLAHLEECEEDIVSFSFIIVSFVCLSVCSQISRPQKFRGHSDV